MDSPDGFKLGKKKGSKKKKPSDSVSEEVKSPSPGDRGNVFDYEDEVTEDIFDQTPAAHLKKIQDRRAAAVAAKPIVPNESVETIGGTYAGEESNEEQLQQAQKGRAQSVIVGEPRGRVVSPNRGRIQSFTPGSSSPHAAARLKEVSSGWLGRPKEPLDEEPAADDEKKWEPPSKEETIDRIFFGKTYSLDRFKSKNEKATLLDLAVFTGDGNTIMTILLFLRRTLAHGQMLNTLAGRQEACQVYSSYLKQKYAWTELRHLYGKVMNDTKAFAYHELGRCNEEYAATSKDDIRETKIRKCKEMASRVEKAKGWFETEPQLSDDKQYVIDYNKLLQLQIRIEEEKDRAVRAAMQHRGVSVLFTPLSATLLYCFRFYNKTPDFFAYPAKLKSDFNISEKLYFQIHLQALIVDSNNWKEFDELLTSKGVMGVGRKKRSVIGFERVVKMLGLNKYQTPPDVMKKYLMEVEDPSVRADLATRYKYYDIAIESIKEAKDRARLEVYINYIPVPEQAKYRDRIDDILQNSQIKWR